MCESFVWGTILVASVQANGLAANLPGHTSDRPIMKVTLSIQQEQLLAKVGSLTANIRKAKTLGMNRKSPMPFFQRDLVDVSLPPTATGKHQLRSALLQFSFLLVLSNA